MSIQVSSRRAKFVPAEHDQFYETLRQRVSYYFIQKNTSRYGNRLLTIKAIFWAVIFIGSYALILSNRFSVFGLIILTIIFGFSMLAIGINIGHEASHKAFSRNPAINNLLAHVMDVLGFSAKAWDVLHNKTHHPFVNIPGNDSDIETGPFIRVSKAMPYKKIFKYQHFYCILLYSSFTLFWVFFKDFHFFSNRKAGSAYYHAPSFKEYAFLIGTKCFYFFYTVALPIMVLNVPWWYVIIGFFFFHMTMGITVGFTFLTTHYVEEVEQIDLPPSNEINCNWSYHVLRSTVDFGTQNLLYNWCFGGLNTHVAHHLFPNISHIHHPDISLIISKTARQFGYPYFEHTSILTAFRSHLKFLKKLGKS